MKKTLSDNELTLKEINELLPIDSNTKFYAGEVIKQFIKDLKFKLCNPEWNEDYKFNERWIDKLAGNKLIEEKQ